MNRKGFTMMEIIVGGIVIVCTIGYVMNIVKLVSCDFKAPYKAEIIHGAGLVTGLGTITGYLNVGK